MSEKLPLLYKATKMAFEQHEGQFRKGTGIPYVNHLCEVTSRVAHYLLHMGTDSLSLTKDEVLAASMLHDVVEDCDVEYESLVNDFGKGVADLVMECTREDGHEERSQKWDFLMSFKGKSLESLLIKISDRYQNVNDYYRTPEKMDYASTYALQAYPLYRAFLEKVHGEKIPGTEIVVVDLQQLQAIINKVYTTNIAQDSLEDKVRALVV
jgi:(p)ppGpp synthase/HD superfamily hydrolase